MSLSLLCFAVAGYYMMYHLFFQGIGLEKLALDRYETPTVAMEYEGVQWFRSRRIATENSIEIITYSIPELDRESNPPVLELFVQLENFDETEPDPSKQVATLIIEQQPDPDTTIVEEFPLYQVRQQRFATNWITFTPKRGSEIVPNTFRGKIEIADDSSVKSILLGTRIHANLHRFACPWYLAGLLLFVTWATAGYHWTKRIFWLMLGTFVVLLAFRAGAFVSNDFFLDSSGKASVFKTSFGHMKRFVGAGEWYAHVYKQVGHFLVPAISILIEPFSVSTPTTYYVETFPLPRFIWFILEAGGVMTLTLSICRYLSPKVALIFPFVYVTFPPILFDIYNMEDDALLIIGMLFLTALLIKMAAQKKLQWKDIFLCAGIMLCMLSSKTTIVFLVVTIPFGLLAARWFNSRRDALRRTSSLFGLLIIAFMVSKAMTALAGPELREAQPGYEYQDNNLYDMLWAANGLYDRDSAHPFIKKGTTRDYVVAQHIADAADTTVDELFPNGTKDYKRLRHSKIGDELVFKPDLVATWKERPTFFINNQVIRLWKHGLLFYGYPDRGRYWRLDLDEGSEKLDIGQEEELKFSDDNIGRLGARTLIQRSRFDETWKIAAQIYTVSLFNLDRIDDRVANLVLTLLAILGIALMRRLDLGIIFLSCVSAKIIFNTIIHGKVRYFDWVHVPMLVGLSVILLIIITLVLDQSKNLIRKRDDHPYKPPGES